MKLLLTSAGIRNPSIHAALVELLGKPTAEANALCITTASYGHPSVNPQRAWSFVSGVGSKNPMVELGWKTMGLLEPMALPHIPRERWEPWIRAADVLLVNGGDALFLAHWVRESGLADLVRELPDPVWCGLSAGSMIMAPRMGADFIQWQPPDGEDRGLGIVPFSIGPHLAPDGMPGNSMAELEAWAATIDNPAYAIDDETAIKVVDGKVEVISEGQWRLLNAPAGGEQA
jgi:dipeptidase E